MQILYPTPIAALNARLRRGIGAVALLAAQRIYCPNCGEGNLYRDVPCHGCGEKLPPLQKAA